MGHATRCIPIIRHLLDKGCEVVLISSGRSLLLLQAEFPNLKTYNVPAYNIEYQRKGNFLIKIVLQLQKVFRGIGNEQKETTKIAEIEKPDLIISDNRYGVYSHNVKSVIISHQMQVKIPSTRILEPVVQQWLYNRHKKFDSVWIPDVKDEPNISGDLGHTGKLHPDTKYLGVLTRFENNKEIITNNKLVLVILSGPEPQRSILEEIILQQAAELPFQFIVVQGKSEKKETKHIQDNIQLITYCTTDELNHLILQSEIIISRGGYSTLMDLALFGKKCIFIPTPGQTEQEYLVQTLAEKKLVVKADQQSMRLKTIIEFINLNNIRFYIPASKDLYQKIVDAEID